jgi:osmoprotectant transport system ATP-binding protein
VNVIEFKRVTKCYNAILALNDFSLEVREGELMVLLGPSGCGKSTAIRLANALIQPDAGEILLHNQNIKQQNPAMLRRKIGYVIQGVGLFPHYSVAKNIATVPQLLGWNKEKIGVKVDELLELVGISQSYKNKYPHELSGGESQRVGVARALAADPKILLMDEPFGSLDPLTREKLQREFRKIQKRLQKTVIFVTHDISEAIQIADKIAIMRKGRLISCNTPAAFIHTFADDSFIKNFLGQDYALKVLSRFTVSEAMKSMTSTKNENSILQTITPDEPLSTALSLMAANSKTKLRVVRQNGTENIGVICIEEIFSFLKKVGHDSTV